MQRPNEVGPLRLLSESWSITYWMVMHKKWLDILRKAVPCMESSLHYQPTDQCLWSISTYFTAAMSQRELFFFKDFFKILDWTVLLKFYLYVPLAPRILCLEANPSFPPTAYTHAIPPGFPISPMTVLSSIAPKWKFQPFLVGHPVQYNSPSKNS